MAEWVKEPLLEPINWKHSSTPEEWRVNTTSVPGIPAKMMRTLMMLVMWEIWKERNARVFEKKEFMTQALLAKIKSEANVWLLASAKPLAFLLLGE